MNQKEALEKARDDFLNQGYGCAETMFMVLKERYFLEKPEDPSPAMVLNGGVAYSGGVCGVISGAALAVGMLAEDKMEDHQTAKSAGRLKIAELIQSFREKFGSENCRDLIGWDLQDEAQHQQFIEGGLWRTQCMAQIELAIKQLWDLDQYWGT